MPSTAFGRAFGFARLGATLAAGAAGDRVRAALGADGPSASGAALSPANADRLATALCRMRGAALKLGQMLSIQDASLVPPPLAAALARVRAGADVMPPEQLEEAMAGELGSEWRSRFASFDDAPIAAASIGQVHAAVAPCGTPIAVKVQYPGVADSIVADVDNLLRVAALTGALPRGLYVEAAAAVAKKELALECDYVREGECAARWGALLAGDKTGLAAAVRAPRPFPGLTTRRVLATEFLPGAPIDAVAADAPGAAPQEVRNALGATLLRLTLRELFAWRFMQTDPNWGNFLFDPTTGVLACVDFGACREFEPSFVDPYLSMVRACAARDEDTVLRMSRELGFLTGDESAAMNAAHVGAALAVGAPFAAPGPYDFGAAASLTAGVAAQGRVMLDGRLTPPPEQSYSLHRRLSGAFLACIKLGAVVPARALLEESIDMWEAENGRKLP